MKLKTLLDTYQPADDREAAHRDAMLRLCTVGMAARSRNHYLPGHFTASALVLSPDCTHLALIRHPKLRRWLQPGGHLEREDGSPMLAALREVEEEVGISQIKLLDLELFDLDVHDIPENPREPAHQHFDLRYAFISEIWELEGAHEARWVPLEQIDEAASDASVMRAVGKLMARLALDPTPIAYPIQEQRG